MKKYILSFLLIVIFAIYAFYQKMGGSSAVYVASNNPITPTTSVNTDTTTNSNSSPQPAKNSPIDVTPTPTPITSTPAPVPIPAPAPVVSMYKDGTFTGSVADAYYGNVQVSAIISGGQITNINFLQYPNDRGTSVRINSQAMPMLKSEAVAAQSYQVDGVSGATQTSRAFIQSLQSALAIARN